MLKENLNERKVSIEVFNGCSGGCPGCSLSVNDRAQSQPLIPLPLFQDFAKKIAHESARVGQPFLVEILFGDFLSLSYATQSSYYRSLKENGINIGFTGNFASKSLSAHYLECLSLIADSYGKTGVLNITIDPFRLDQDWYVENLKNAFAYSKYFREFHTQILLSTTLIKKQPAKVLHSKLQVLFGEGFDVALVASPPSNNDKSNRQQYDFVEAERYFKEFYGATPFRKAFLERELTRFKDSGISGGALYNGFSETIFTHLFIESNGEVSPIVETVFGDVILGKRFGPGYVFGNIFSSPSMQLLSDNRNKVKFVTRNGTRMASSKFNCPECVYYSECIDKGIGLAREAYRGWETRTKSCLGPKNIVGSRGGSE